MKKNIGIGVLALITILSIMYAYVQKSTASKQQELAVKNFEIANKERERLLIEIKLVNEQRELLEEQLKKLRINCH